MYMKWSHWKKENECVADSGMRKLREICECFLHEQIRGCQEEKKHRVYVGFINLEKRYVRF